MIWLAWRQTVYDPRSYGSIGVTAFAGALVLVLVGAAAVVEGRWAGETAGAFGTILAFAVVVLVTAVSSVASLSVRSERQLLASWTIIGLSPGRLFRSVLIRSVIGSTAGSLLAVPVALSLVVPLDLAYASIGLLPHQPSSEEVAGAMIVAVPLAVVATVLLAACATVPAARHAARTDPARILRESDHDSRPSLVTRGLLSGGMLLLTVPPLIGALVIGGPGLPEAGRTQREALRSITPVERVMAIQASVSFLLVIATAIVMPAAAPHLLKAWTALVPGRGSPIWFLARRAAAERAAVTAPAVTVGGLMLGMVGSVQGSRDLARMLGGSQASDWSELLVTLGPSAALATVGAAATLTIGRSAEVHDIRQLVGMGLNGAQVRRLETLKVLIYTITALLPAAALWLLSVAGSAVLAPALGVTVSWSPPDPRPMLVVAACLALSFGVALGAHSRPPVHLGGRSRILR